MTEHINYFADDEDVSRGEKIINMEQRRFNL